MFRQDKKPSLLEIGGHLNEYSDYELESIINIVKGEQQSRKHLVEG